MSDLRIAVANMRSTPDVNANLSRIAAYARNASERGCDLLLLPENATNFAPVDQRLENAEPLQGTQVLTCIELARTWEIAIHVGSFAELTDDPERSANTSVFIDADGNVLGTYRKMHLFDVDVASDASFKESESTVAGAPEPVVFEWKGWKLGMSVCYDVRFPELYRALVDQGAELLLVPAAFTYRTGAAHWEPLMRARAIENTSYVVASAQTGVVYGTRECWGHSVVVDPWGTVVAQAGHEEGLIVADIQRDAVDRVRGRLPSLSNRRM